MPYEIYILDILLAFKVSLGTLGQSKSNLVRENLFSGTKKWHIILDYCHSGLNQEKYWKSCLGLGPIFFESTTPEVFKTTFREIADFRPIEWDIGPNTYFGG